jgi:molybdopterin molybdotransferase
MALMPVADALDNILTGVMPLGPEEVGLRFASGRVLAYPLTATLTNPPFDASSMDGYAVRHADIAAHPARLRIIGEAAAGHPFSGHVNQHEAVRIFTGAPIPDGADTVVIQENTRNDKDHVTISEAAPAGSNIRARGQDFHEGDLILQRGKCLSTRDLLLAATAGHAMFAAVKRPVVAILATGDELVEPSDRPLAGQIVSSNSYGLAALIEAAGGIPKMLGIAQDNVEDLATKLRDAETADILVTTGGASVGDHDLVRPALEAAGCKLHFYKIAMRPGKPMFFGTRPGPSGTQRILGLPGNPVSAMIGARVFLAPLIGALLGRPAPLDTLTATLAVPLEANGPRDHYMRATLEAAGSSQPRVTPFENQDSALVSTLAAANCLIINPANAPAQAAGQPVTVMRLDF